MKLQMYKYLLIILFTYGLGFAQLNVKTVFKLPVGSGVHKIAIFEDQSGMDYDISSNGDLYLLDAVNNKVKVFTSNGEYKLSISIPEEVILRLYIYQNWLILLTQNTTLNILDLTGELLAEYQLDIKNSNLPNSYFYKDMIFIPQIGSDFFSSNLFLYKIHFNLQKSLFAIKKSGRLEKSYDPDRKHQFFPVEKEYRAFLRKMNVHQFKNQNNEFILIRIYEEGFEKYPVYYVFLKKRKAFKKIGKLPYEKIGEVYSSGWGSCHKFYGKNLYILGVQYSDKIPRQAKYVTISKINLSNIEGFPTLEPNWNND